MPWARSIVMISVIIPTYKRPELLRRAVQSVLNQTLTDWELVISDDEAPSGEAWAYLNELAAKDPRIRITRNTGAHGQVGNVNHCLQQVRGDWVKPLFDDDVLLPNCLEAFLEAVEGRPEVALAGCLAHRFYDGEPRRAEPVFARSAMEITSQRYAHLAMYLQDGECGTMPTQMFINAAAIRAGALMAEDAQLFSAVDQLWFAEILRHGDRLHLPLILVEEHQGSHESVTSTISRTDLDAECLVVKERLLKYIPADVKRPSLAVACKMMLGIRGLHRIANRHYCEGLKLLIASIHPYALWLTMQWVLRKLKPGYFTSTQRVRIN